MHIDYETRIQYYCTTIALHIVSLTVQYSHAAIKSYLLNYGDTARFSFERRKKPIGANVHPRPLNSVPILLFLYLCMHFIYNSYTKMLLKKLTKKGYMEN